MRYDEFAPTVAGVDERLHRFRTTEASWCAGIGGSWTAPDVCDVWMLTGAIELSDDRVGNDNGICQSGGALRAHAQHRSVSGRLLV